MDVELVRGAAATRWAEITGAIAGIDPELLDGKHHPCPKCGGRDRFRAFDDGTGGAICNQCFSTKNGDGFSVIQWLTGADFIATVGRVADYLGIKIENGKRKKVDPEEHLEFLDWPQTLVESWCARKPPIKAETVQEFGGRYARYRGTYLVIAIPIWGAKLIKAKPVGWVLYNITGRTLPVYSKDQPPEWRKTKITRGSSPGIVGPVAKLENLAEIKTVIKAEGVTDALALEGITPDGTICISNSNGAKQRPQKWILEKIAKDRRTLVIHDADQPGEEGATWVGEQDGRKRPGWAPALAEVASECRHLRLPYPIVEEHGQDVRDWLDEGNGWPEFESLAEAAEIVKPEESSPDDGSRAIEEDDDPHRLARVNLHRYASRFDGATLRFWREEWYTWKRDRYRKISEKELSAKVNQAIKEEFDRLNIEEQRDTDKEEIGKAKRVTRSLVWNVLAATESLTVVPAHVELGTWIDDVAGIREKRNYIGFRNGLLDLDAMFSNDPNVMLEHSPRWFSTVCLPYGFDPRATCPKWLEFLDFNLEGDQERIDLLQEWAGYLLLPDTGQQKFLVLEGEGANGKSVYCAAVEAMLGTHNCSHVSLEIFGDRFSRTQTLGKLCNIASDAAELDRVAEGFLKSFTSGEMMFFDRKNIDGIDTYPTARLMMACNNRPRFSDRSEGIMRRMILVPWQIQVPQQKRVANMDKPWWWERSGELPGILIWALRGLYRLREQGEFTDPKICQKAKAEYKSETNPARQFLTEKTRKDLDGYVIASELYDRYARWARENGFKPLASNSFGKEVRRAWPGSSRERLSVQGSRPWCYLGVRMQYDDQESGQDAESDLF